MTRLGTLRPAPALGLWWAANLCLYETVIATGWPVGADFPREYRVGLLRSLGVSGAVATALGLFVVLFLLVEGWRLFERLTAMDPSGVADRSVSWTARVLWRARIFVALGLVLPPLLFLLPEENLTLLIVPIGGLYLWALVGVPLSVFRQEVVGSETGAGWWRPRWPGFGPLTSAVGLSLILWLLPWLPLVLVLRQSLLHLLWGAPLVLATALLGPAAIAAVLVYRLPPKRALERASTAVSWRTVGPVLALDARLLLACLFVLAPVIAVWFFLWQMVPALAQWQLGQGLQLPFTARVLVNGANAIGQYAVWWWSLPAAVLACLLDGRLVFLLGTQGRPR